MVSRCCVLALALVLMMPAAGEAEMRIPDSGTIDFEIRRDGQTFGSHVLRFSRDDKGRRIVRIDIEMSYCLGPICLFRYEHKNRVVWDDGQVVKFKSRTNDDGDRYKVRASWGDDKVAITANGAERNAPANAAPTTYWYEDMLEADQLINTQKGTVQDIKIVREEPDTYMVAGEMRDARHYVIQTDRKVEVWYDAATGQWIGLEFKAKGSKISYHRRSKIKTSKIKQDSQ
jgi:hypothetical protein